MSDPGTSQPNDQGPAWPPVPPTDPAPLHAPPPTTPPLWQSSPSLGEVTNEPTKFAAPPSFCPSCGTAWQAEWLACPRCSANDGLPSSTASVDTAQPVNLVAPLALYFLLLGSLLVVFAMASENAREAANAITAFDIGSAILVLLWAAAVGTRGMGPIKVFVHAKWLLGMFPAAIGTFLFAVFSMTALTYAFDIPEVGITDMFFEAGYGWTAVILLVCLQPAIIEELAFRGVILHGLRGAMSDREAIVVSSLMFAILHLNFLGIPYLFVVGAVAGWIRIKSGSLLPCMLLHFCHNFLVIAQEAGWLGF